MGESTNALVERQSVEHRGALRALFQRRSRATATAELAQEVYRLMLRLPDTATNRNPESCLFTVANSVARKQRFVERRYLTASDVEECAGEGLLAELPVAAGEVDTEQRCNRLREVLGQLPPKCQAVVALQYWHGMGYAQIAELLGISTPMVKKFANQALTHCRLCMARLG